MNAWEVYNHVYRIQQEASLDGDEDRAVEKLYAVYLLATGLLERLHEDLAPRPPQAA